MNPEYQSLEEVLFDLAVKIQTAEERAAFLERVCSGDPGLRAQIEELLEAHFGGTGFLPQAPPQPGPAVAAPAPAEAPAVSIGRYTLLEKIGEGGFGEVWMAEQREPVRRRVALKFIKPGMDSREVIARFQAERQALALMDHPHIARILDADVTPAGRPYFVMELVRGVRITEYSDQNLLPLEDRLRLFVKVCLAIQHAHEKGVIHRDIKPSNILVALHEGRPVPRVIDFGIAKAIHQDLTDATFFTRFQQFMGTPAYISPEQAEMGGLDIDPRADVYSLGVLLYELLVGQTPFDPKELAKAGLQGLRKAIREEDPPRPSSRLSTLSEEQQTATGRRRQTPVDRLTRRLRGDLDWIVMKCLEKDRTRRYATASALADDVERHLAHQPVTARPPSAAYRLRKGFQRHRRNLAVAAWTSVVIAGALAAGAWWRARSDVDLSLAVIPFGHSGPEEKVETLAGGLTDGLARDLSKFLNLRVTASSLTRRFKRAEVDPVAAGRDLAVHWVVAGAVREGAATNGLVVRADLLDARAGVLAWSRDFRGANDEVGTIQKTIRDAVVEHLRMRFPGELRQRMDRQVATNPEVYRLYARGRASLDRRTPEGITEAIGLFEKAAAIDPKYAPAYSGIADCQCLIAQIGEVPPIGCLRKAREAAQRALDLDDGLAEAHTTLAAVTSLLDFDWVAAERGYRRALELNPNYALAHSWYASRLLTPLGRHEEAISHAARAVELERGAVAPLLNQAAVWFGARRFQEAAGSLRRLVEAEPGLLPARFMLACALSFLGQDADALAQIPDANAPGQMLFRSYLLSRVGRTNEAVGVLRAADQAPSPAYGSEYERAIALLGLGRTEEALRSLEQAQNHRDWQWPNITVSPFFDPISHDERFKALLQRAHLR